MPLDFRTGQPRWMDLLSRDSDRAVRFYTELFGWQAESAGPEFGGYVTFSLDGKAVGGLMANPADSGVDDCWTPYLEVADASAAVDAARADGGEVLEHEQLADMGIWFVLTDATGARVGGWQNFTHSGFEVVEGVGAPVWTELHARDYDRAVGFYESAFGWQPVVLSDTEEMRYTTLGEGADAVAGIWDASGDLAEIEASYWEVYLGVANANETAVRIAELGGAVLEQVVDSPYGRMAPAVNPTGARFSIMQVD